MTRCVGTDGRGVIAARAYAAAVGGDDPATRHAAVALAASLDARGVVRIDIESLWEAFHDLDLAAMREQDAARTRAPLPKNRQSRPSRRTPLGRLVLA